MSWGFGRRRRARQTDQAAATAVAQWQVDAATPSLEQALTVLLRELGTTVAEVALNLRVARVTGWAGSPCTCPVARYVQRALGARFVSVAPTSIVVRLYDDQDTVMIAVPSPVRDFIEAFDSAAALDGLVPTPYVDLMANRHHVRRSP